MRIADICRHVIRIGHRNQSDGCRRNGYSSETLQRIPRHAPHWDQGRSSLRAVKSIEPKHFLKR
jgi:hypothetical protein